MGTPDLINIRERVPRKAIENVAEQIRRKFRPEKIILFGSYAHGISRPDSDVDLLVVMKSSKSTLRQAIEILQDLEYDFPLDLIVRSPEELKRRVELGIFY